MSQESDINYLIGGLIFGSVITFPIGFLIPNVELGVRLGVGAIGSVAGIAVGYCFAWNAKRIRRRRVARTIKKQNETALPPMPTQIAGKTCSSCESLVVFAPEGSFCKICRRPFCVTCKGLRTDCAECIENQTENRYGSQ